MFELTVSDPGRPAAPRGRRVAATKVHQLPGLQPPAVTSVGRDSITLTFPCHVVIMLWVAQLLLLLGAFPARAWQNPFLWRRRPFSALTVQSCATTCSPSHVLLVAIVNRGFDGQCNAAQCH